MKKLIGWVLAVVLLAGLLPVAPGARAAVVASGYCGADPGGTNLTWTLDDAGTLTISGTGAMKDFNPIYLMLSTEADTPWFDIRESITKVVIDEGVTTIGNFAFYKCVNLTEIIIPSTLGSFGISVLSVCGLLTSITAEPANANYITEDGVLFNKAKTELVRCPSGKSGAYTIPNGVTSIGDHAFESCLLLTSVTIPDGVTSLGYSAFRSSGLTGVIIPDSVTSIGEVAFASSLIKSITLPRGLTSLSYGLFNGSSLITVTIPDSVTYIGSAAFGNCSSLISIAIPNGVTSIEDRTFVDCRALTSVTIPDSVTKIDDLAFSGCRMLTGIKLPDNLTTIGDEAFDNCLALTNVTLPDGLISIGDNAFNYTALTHVTIPDSVTHIGNFAFGSCSALTRVFVPSSTVTFGTGVFRFGNAGFAIFGVPGGTANQYATANSHKFYDINTSTFSVTIVGAAGTFVSGNYVEGDTVHIGSLESVTGKKFSHWTADPTVIFYNANSPTTTFIMPGSAVTVTANYVPTPSEPVIVPSSTGDGAFIDLTDETITLPAGFTVTSYSVNGGAKWKNGALPTGTKFQKLLDKGMTLHIKGVLHTTNGGMGTITDQDIIMFPKIEPRPKKNAEKLKPFYASETWALKTKAGGDATNTYEWANTTDKKTPSGDWQIAGDFEIKSGKAKTTYLFRTPATANGNTYTPASKVFKLTPKNFGKAPSSYKTKTDSKTDKKTVKLKANDWYLLPDAADPVKVGGATELDVSDMEGTLTVWKGETGKKPRSEKITFELTPSAAAA